MKQSNRMQFILGGSFYIFATLQYFFAQIITASVWHPAYSWRHNYISDLGNTACGNFALPHAVPAYVCSPYNALMNLSFVLSGVLLIVGTILLKHFWLGRKLSSTAFVFFLLAGIGKIVLGFVPENTNLSVHSLTALNIPIANLAILLFSIAIFHTRKRLAVTGFVAAIVGLIGTILLVAAEVGNTKALFGQGVGTMERIAGYPANIWMVIIGIIVIIEVSSLRLPRGLL